MTTTHETPSHSDTSYREDILASFDHTAPVRTPADVLEVAARLVQTAHKRQWWLFLLDENGRVAPVVPQLEMPRRFGEREAEQVAALLSTLLQQGCTELAIVWEQPGIGDADELIGPSLLHAALTRLGRPPLAQVVVLSEFRVRLWEPPAPGADEAR